MQPIVIPNEYWCAEDDWVNFHNPGCVCQPMKNRESVCSFCRKSYQEVGPLVEGSDGVYICGECAELCQGIIEQEKRRRDPDPPPASGPEALRAALDRIVAGQDEAKAALTRAVARRHDGAGRVLFTGPSPGARLLLARALAHVLEAPFAAADPAGLAPAPPGAEGIPPLLKDLLFACDFDIQQAQRGVLYVDGVDGRDTQEALLRLWQGAFGDSERLGLDARRILFVCGGTFAGLSDAVARPGRHDEQPVDREALAAAGMLPEMAYQFTEIARVTPLDEASLTRVVPWLDFSRVSAVQA
jgi:ATP-dependent Clp protease ATP-binding subunit ClpX